MKNSDIQYLCFPEYSLSVQDSYAYKELFKLADDKSKLFLFKNEAMSFFSSTGIPVALLEEVRKRKSKETSKNAYNFSRFSRSGRQLIKNKKNI